MRENATAISLAVDLLFDHGVALVREKSAMLALLEKADFISKASGLIQGSQTMNTSHGRLCQSLSTMINQLPVNPNAFWRQSSAIMGHHDQADGGNASIVGQTIKSKECKVHLVEKLDGIVGPHGEILTQDLSSEL